MVRRRFMFVCGNSMQFSTYSSIFHYEIPKTPCIIRRTSQNTLKYTCMTCSDYEPYEPYFTVIHHAHQFESCVILTPSAADARTRPVEEARLAFELLPELVRTESDIFEQ